MSHYTDHILYKTHQHFLVVVFKFLSQSVPVVVFILLAGNLVFDWNIFLQLVIILLATGTIFGWHYFFWVKSYFLITNEKIVVKVRNGIFSKFHMSIHFKNIRDTAFSKNHILHYFFDYGTLFARSSAGAVGDLEGRNLPHIEKIYHIVNMLHNMDEAQRKHLRELPQGEQKTDIDSTVQTPTSETREQAAEKEKQTLLMIQGIKEVVELTDTDRRFIFEHEEDRNHGVYESLRRQLLFAATHDSTLREPDEAIVMQAGKKVVFPVVEFHEIKRKKVSSSSPGMEIHKYLVPKFQNFGEYDATLIIGFDI